MQEELVKGLLSTETVTIVGVLLAVIALLVYWVLRQDKKLELMHEYQRGQDKDTLKILGELTNVLKDRQEHDREVKSGVTEIKDTVKDNNTTLTSLNQMIQAKILGMH